jgi:hypothetical protein
MAEPCGGGGSAAPPAAALQPPPSLQQQLLTDAAAYAACYCEENVLRLAQHPLAQPLLPPSEPAYVCLISNARQRVAVRCQRAGAGRPHGAVLWDYHAVLLTRRHVLDLDSALPFPTPTAQYLAASFAAQDAAAGLGPCFRLLPLALYRARFASDRRHMARGDDGSFAAPPPPWACLRGAQAAGPHTLGELLRMEAAAAGGGGGGGGGGGEGDGPGLVLGSVGELWRALEQPPVNFP